MTLHFLKSMKMTAVMRVFFLCVLVSALGGIVCSPAQAAVYYVKQGATGASGLSWADTEAFGNLQSALSAAAENDQIWVAAGTYSPGPSAADSFSLLQGVGIYGGFNGTETSLTERNWTANVTILDGGNINEHAVRCGTVTSSAVLDGFTIRGGAGISVSQGGGLYNSGGSPTIRNCIFTANAANQGAGIYNDGGSPAIENCTFSGNSSGGTGGGICNYNSSPVITGCTFSGNQSSGGSGIYNEGGSPVIENCTFSENAVSDGYGGAIFNYDSSPTITGSTFTGNSSSSGSGIYNSGGGSSAVENCTFSGNTASEGGGIYNETGTMNITNSTFIGNSATSGGGGIFNAGTLTIFHTIVADSSGATGVTDLYNESGGTVTSDYNIVEITNIAPSGAHDIIGDQPSLNIDSLADNGGPTKTHALLSGSIAIDAGDPSAVNLPSYDQRGSGFPRVKNGRVDIGAYESDPPVPEIDLSQNTTAIAGGGSFDFGEVAVNTDSGPVVFLISNTGTADLILSGTPDKISLSGTNASEFSIDQVGLISPVQPSGDTTFSVTFAPASEGSKAAVISIANNDDDENPYIVNLAGTGKAANLPPEILHLDGDTVTYTGEPLALDQGNDAAVTDSDNTTFLYGYLTVEISGGDAEDVLELSNDADGDGNSATGIFADANETVFYDNVPVGYIGTGFENTILKVFFETGFSDAVTAAMVGDLIRAVRYSTTASQPGATSKSISFTLYDGADYSVPAWVSVSFQQLYRLSVSISGSGSVSGDGIACPSDCYEYFPAGQTVWLSASPYSGYILSGWSGVQDQSGHSASVAMNSDKTVTVIFTASSPYYPDDPHYPTDLCPYDPLKTEPGICGCGVADTDTDGDGTADCKDNCPNDPGKTEEGICGCGVPDTDTDGDGTADCKDNCPNDPGKTEEGICGCGVPDTDTDGDGTADCKDNCPNDPGKTEEGICGCGVSDTDTDGDGTADCKDNCPNDPGKTEEGICGCGVSDTDTDGDGTADCKDNCPNDPGKTEEGICGCGIADEDTDGDGVIDCLNNTPPDPPNLSDAGNKVIYPPGAITLKTGPFYDENGDSHLETVWVIYRADNACGEIFMEHASATDLTQFAVTGLPAGVKYVWKAGFRDSGSRKLVWSEEMLTFIVGENAEGESVHSEPGTEVSDYQMFSFPYWHTAPSSEKILGRIIGTYDKKYFRIGTYNPETGQYVEYGPNLEFEPGRAYWFLTRNGMDIPWIGIPVSTEKDMNVKLVFNPIAENGWNMVAVPNSADYLWENVEIVIGDGCISIPISQLPEDNPYISKKLWLWDENGYSPDADRMEKGKGYWVKVKQKGIWLRFRADKQIPSESGLLSRTGNRIWKSLSPDTATAGEEDSPPMPPGGFTESTSASDSGGGGCFLRTAQEK
ncbi:MAG: choice-of-anchor Q domain-containing protein [Desulfobacterales bacterium]